jgi:uncharacterized membrane protein
VSPPPTDHAEDAARTHPARVGFRLVVAVAALFLMWIGYSEFSGPRGSTCAAPEADRIDRVAVYMFIAATLGLVLAVIRRSGFGCLVLVVAAVLTVIAGGTGFSCLR